MFTVEGLSRAAGKFTERLSCKQSQTHKVIYHPAVTPAEAGQDRHNLSLSPLPFIFFFSVSFRLMQYRLQQQHHFVALLCTPVSLCCLHSNSKPTKSLLWPMDRMPQALLQNFLVSMVTWGGRVGGPLAPPPRFPLCSFSSISGKKTKIDPPAPGALGGVLKQKGTVSPPGP